MAALRRVGRSLGSVTAGGAASTLPGPDYSQSEEDAFRAIDETEQIFIAAAKAAFGERSDPLRTYGEAFVRAGAAHLRAHRALTDRQASRYRESSERAASSHYSDTGGTHFQVTGAISDSSSSALSRSRACLGWIAGACGIAFSVGVLIGHWHADGADAAASRLTNLRSEAIEASSQLAQAKAGMSDAAARLIDALGASQSGLSIIHRLSTLPEAEQAAMEDIISDFAFRQASVSLTELRDLLRISPFDRGLALTFAKLGDTEFRQDFLEVAKLASLHAKYYFTAGERNYPGCVTNGPVMRASNGVAIKTCLVEIPQLWAEPDTVLYHLYNGK